MTLHADIAGLPPTHAHGLIVFSAVADSPHERDLGNDAFASLVRRSIRRTDQVHLLPDGTIAALLRNFRVAVSVCAIGERVVQELAAQSARTGSYRLCFGTAMIERDNKMSAQQIVDQAREALARDKVSRSQDAIAPKRRAVALHEI